MRDPVRRSKAVDSASPECERHSGPTGRARGYAAVQLLIKSPTGTMIVDGTAVLTISGNKVTYTWGRTRSSPSPAITFPAQAD